MCATRSNGIVYDPAFERVVYGLPILVEVCPACGKLLRLYLICKLCGDPVNDKRKRRYENEDLCISCHNEVSANVYIPNKQQIDDETELIRSEWSRREELHRRVGISNERIAWIVPRMGMQLRGGYCDQD